MRSNLVKYQIVSAVSSKNIGLCESDLSIDYIL